MPTRPPASILMRGFHPTPDSMIAADMHAIAVGLRRSGYGFRGGFCSLSRKPMRIMACATRMGGRKPCVRQCRAARARYSSQLAKIIKPSTTRIRPCFPSPAQLNDRPHDVLAYPPADRAKSGRRDRHAMSRDARIRPVIGETNGTASGHG
jgi:hypothetical protein